VKYDQSERSELKLLYGLLLLLLLLLLLSKRLLQSQDKYSI